MPKYHMTKKEREITDEKELKRILKQGKYAVISMCRDNEPYIVTLSYGYDEENNCLYFHSGLKGLKIDFIHDNPNVCATIIEDRGYKKDDCSHDYLSIVMWGTITVLEGTDEKKNAMNILLNHLEENPDPIKKRSLGDEKIFEKIALLKLDIREITGKRGS